MARKTVAGKTITAPTAFVVDDLNDATFGALVRRSIESQLAVAAPARRQAAVLAKQAEVEAARQRLSAEQAERAEQARTGASILRTFIRRSVTIPSLDLAEVVFAELAPTGVTRRYAEVGLPEDATWAQVAGAHVQLALLTSQEPAPEPEPVDIEAPIQTPVATVPEDVSAKRAYTPEEELKIEALMSVLGLTQDAAEAALARA